VRAGDLGPLTRIGKLRIADLKIQNLGSWPAKRR